jgi:hypothetical protein
MTEQQKFEQVKSLIDKLGEERKTGRISFKDMTEKLSLQTLYQMIYGNVQVQLSCDTCVRFYLEQLEAWYQREFPKYEKTLQVEVEQTEIKVEELKEESAVEIKTEEKPIKTNNRKNMNGKKRTAHQSNNMG